MSDKIRAETIPEHDIFRLPVPPLHQIHPLSWVGLMGPISPENGTGKLQKIRLSIATSKGEAFMPRMSKKRKLEWQFFLNHRSRVTYNDLCRKCVHGCKQSFRSVVMDCPHYLSKRATIKDHDTL